MEVSFNFDDINIDINKIINLETIETDIELLSDEEIEIILKGS